MCQSIPRWYHQDGELEPDVVARRYMRIALQAVGTAPATLRAVTEASVAASERSSARTAARAAKRTEI
jgi:replication-associated recombination protein RarA